VKTALVLSGGGMFGAWQAGAWRALAMEFKPDLVVGVSVGALNGYAIAAGWNPNDLCDWWLRPGMAGFKNLPHTIQALVAAKPLQLEYATVVVDVLKMNPRTVLGPSVTPVHLLASCAVPGAILPQKIEGSWCVDGGLLNPLPVWVAVELGAQRIIGLNVLPKIPSAILSPFVGVFRSIFGHRPPVPAGVELITLLPSRELGSMREALVWDPQRSANWIAQGARDAQYAYDSQIRQLVSWY
jgi:NTE family protein